jgi:hypothetical protein
MMGNGNTDSRSGAGGRTAMSPTELQTSARIPPLLVLYGLALVGLALRQSRRRALNVVH